MVTMVYSLFWVNSGFIPSTVSLHPEPPKDCLRGNAVELNAGLGSFEDAGSQGLKLAGGLWRRA